LIANACEHMKLSAYVKSGFLGLSKKVIISAYCEKTDRTVKRPEVGCGECHPIPPVFLEYEK
jgi:hypothetical protein